MLADARVTKTRNCLICFTLARGMAGTGHRGGRVWPALLRGWAGGTPGVGRGCLRVNYSISWTGRLGTVCVNQPCDGNGGDFA